MSAKPEALPIVAWLAPDPESPRVVTEVTKAGGRRDGGALHSTLQPYSEPLTDHAQATAQLSALQAEMERLRADAERYRFIRDVPYTENIRLIMSHQSNQIMDAAIDQARQAQKD